jgi:xylose dehydrogenase (NAD/NADP)
VASRDEQRSLALEPQRTHASYQELLDDSEVDAVYICLANHQHHEWALKAMEAGKHVLCEKPLTLTVEQTDSLIACSRTTDRLLVEAAWSRWHPRFQRLQELARSGALGTIQWVDSAFAFTGNHTDNYRANRDMGGGALLDVGCYLVHALVAAIGPDFKADVRDMQQDMGYNQVDLTTRFRLHAGVTEMTGLASIALPEEQRLIVRGDNETVTMHQGQAFTSWCAPSTLKVGDHIEAFPAVDAYELMVEAMSERIQGADTWVIPLEESRTVADVLDRLEDFGDD